MAKFNPGEEAYIIESNRIIRKLEIRSATEGMYLVKFSDSSGGIRVKEHRLYKTREDAEAALPAENKPKVRKGFRSPYDYE